MRVVKAVGMEQGHGLRRRDGRYRCGLSDDASMGSRCEANGIMTEEDLQSGGIIEVDEDGGVLHMLEFRDLGVEAPVASRRRSKLVPVRATCERDFSGVSVTLGPLLGSVEVRELKESSASSSLGEPDERLCIGRSGDRSTHPARRSLSIASSEETSETSLTPAARSQGIRIKETRMFDNVN